MSALVLALAVAASAASPKNEGHQAPVSAVEDKPAADRAERQALLSELWQRRIVSPEMDRWSPDDLGLLERVRAAEREGAVRELKRVYGGLKGWAVPQKDGGLRLTKEGFEKFLFLRSQKALEYFASREIDQKWAFQLTDLEGRKLFDPQGRLTPAGDAVYGRIRANLPAQWKQANGEVSGNRRPGKPQPAAPVEDPAEKLTIGPEHPTLLDQLRRKSGGRYEPVMRGAALGRLMVVVEHDPAGSQGGAVVIVAKAKDKKAARAEFAKRLPDMPAPKDSEVMTVEEKLAALDPSLDKASVRKELDKLLKGRLALVWALGGPPPEEPPPTAPPVDNPALAAPVSAGSGAGAPAGPPAAPPAKSP